MQTDGGANICEYMEVKRLKKKWLIFELLMRKVIPLSGSIKPWRIRKSRMIKAQLGLNSSVAIKVLT